VLLITVDDMNCDSVGVFGSKIPDITPNIDRLASQGLRFERAHVTIAICQPTRAVWMTGRYPHRSGAFGFDPINKGVPTLLEALHSAGYYTGILAKVPHVVPTRGAAWDVVVQASQLANGRDPKAYHDQTSKFLAAAKKEGKPFFLMANAQDPHRPFATAGPKTPRKNPARKPNAKAKNDAPISRVIRPDEVSVPGFLPDLPDIKQELAQYYTSVHRADEVVGSLLSALDESGMADHTLVMFLSDHGMPLPFAKTNCWRHSTRTPWIVRWPGTVKPGQSDDLHFISGIDLAPTVLAAVGLPTLEGADGRSFLPLLKGESQPGRDRVFTQINTTAGKNRYPMRAVQDARFGYIYNGWSNGETVFRNESQAGLTMKAMRKAAAEDDAIAARVKHFEYRTPEELYDYQQDPDALHNLIDDPDYRDVADRMRAQLREQMQATEDSVLKSFDSQVAVDRAQ
jgi:N-sulfoglucosamine sulfohydrolase